MWKKQQKKKWPLSKQCSNNCCRQDPMADTKISRQKGWGETGYLFITMRKNINFSVEKSGRQGLER